MGYKRFIKLVVLGKLKINNDNYINDMFNQYKRLNMNRFKKFSLTISLLILFCNQGFSQLSASFNYSSIPKIGIGYQFSSRIWTELRVISNTRDEDFSPELIIVGNIIKKDRHNIYLGLGASINDFSGIVLPIGLEFYPIESFDRFSLRIEFEPTYTAFDTQELFLMSSFGVKYRFGGNK
jgi:hypothetical protein